MNGFDYFKMAFTRYSDFTGRSRRSEYWYFVLFNALVSLPLTALSLGAEIEIPSLIWTLITFIPSLALSVRRLHDIGKSGWFLLIMFIPLIGLIILIVWACTDSQPGTNEWGPNPKEEGAGVIDHLVDDATV